MSYLLLRTPFGRLGIAILLLLLTITPSAGASAAPADGNAHLLPATIHAGDQQAAVSPPAPPLLAAFLGDRQRIVQVALVVMGAAILILVCGNRF